MRATSFSWEDFASRAALARPTPATRANAAPQLTGPRVVVGDLNEWFWFAGAVGRTLRRELHGPRIRRTHPAPQTQPRRPIGP